MKFFILRQYKYDGAFLYAAKPIDTINKTIVQSKVIVLHYYTTLRRFHLFGRSSRDHHGDGFTHEENKRWNRRNTPLERYTILILHFFLHLKMYFKANI